MATTVNTTNPITVDADAGAIAASTAIYTKPCVITALHWLKPTTAGHKLAVQDASLHEITELYCETADVSEYQEFPGNGYPANGIYIDDMDSGFLYIYIR